MVVIGTSVCVCMCMFKASPAGLAWSGLVWSGLASAHTYLKVRYSTIYEGIEQRSAVQCSAGGYGGFFMQVLIACSNHRWSCRNGGLDLHACLHACTRTPYSVFCTLVERSNATESFNAAVPDEAEQRPSPGVTFTVIGHATTTRSDSHLKS